MIIVKKTTDLRHFLAKNRKSSRSLGFVPTMGALHDGHMSLLLQSKKDNPVSVCSIFVNPAQFNDLTDFKKYPSTLEADILKLEQNGCDALFLPNVEEIYPDGIDKTQQYDLGYLDKILEGASRPGHFQGVCMAVERLLTIVSPDRLYLGQKDYQQCMIIKKLVATMKKTQEIEVIPCPILRENDGLAMSSRNMRLSILQRMNASAIFRVLMMLKENRGKWPIEKLKNDAANFLTDNGFKTDYIEIADATNLLPIHDWNNPAVKLGLVAATIDNIRLIDNMMLL